MAYQRRRMGTKLYQEMERRMRRQGVRMVLMDTESSKAQAIAFFRQVGFGKPLHQVWVIKTIRRAQMRR